MSQRAGEDRWYVECPEYRSHPMSYGQAMALMQELDTEPRNCLYEHVVKERVSLASALLLQPPPPEHESRSRDFGESA